MTQVGLVVGVCLHRHRGCQAWRKSCGWRPRRFPDMPRLLAGRRFLPHSCSRMCIMGWGKPGKTTRSPETRILVAASMCRFPATVLTLSRHNWKRTCEAGECSHVTSVHVRETALPSDAFQYHGPRLRPPRGFFNFYLSNQHEITMSYLVDCKLAGLT